MTLQGKAIPAGPKGHPLFGSVYHFAQNPIEYAVTHRPQYGDFYRVSSPFLKMCLVTDPELVKQILVDKHRCYVKSPQFKMLKVILGRSVLSTEGDIWRRQRRMLNPAFRKDRLVAFAHHMTFEIERLSVYLENACGADKPVDINQEMMNVTLRIISRMLFGKDADLGDNITILSQGVLKAAEYVLGLVKNPLKLGFRWVPTRSNREFARAKRRIYDLILGILAKRRAEGSARDDLVSILMRLQDEESGVEMSDQELLDQIVTLFIAGHDTSSNALSWTFYLLARHPEVAERLVAEVQAVVGEGTPTYEHLPKLTYVTQVLNESMRLYPPVYSFGRQNLEEDQLGPYRIPKKTQMYMVVYQLHRHPDYWEEPDVFNPDRFAPGRPKPHPGAFFPFGLGPRICLGKTFSMLEMTLLLATLMRRFEFRLPEGHRVELGPLVTLGPKGELPMFVSKRRVKAGVV